MLLKAENENKLEWLSNETFSLTKMRNQKEEMVVKMLKNFEAFRKIIKEVKIGQNFLDKMIIKHFSSIENYKEYKDEYFKNIVFSLIEKNMSLLDIVEKTSLSKNLVLKYFKQLKLENTKLEKQLILKNNKHKQRLKLENAELKKQLIKRKQQLKIEKIVSSERFKQFEKLLKEGKTLRQIGDFFNITHQAAHSYYLNNKSYFCVALKRSRKK